MTQSNTQSVRSKAENAATTCRIPTFEEVYEMPYVQESIRSIIDQNVRQFPLLASYKDDIRQELLIALNEGLPKYDGRAGIKTFCRTCLENAMKTIRRDYFREKNLMLSRAEDVSRFVNLDDDPDGVDPKDARAFISQCRNTVEDDLRRKELEDAIAKLPEPAKIIIDGLLEGKSLRSLERKAGIPHATFLRVYLAPIRKALANLIF